MWLAPPVITATRIWRKFLSTFPLLAPIHKAVDRAEALYPAAAIETMFCAGAGGKRLK